MLSDVDIFGDKIVWTDIRNGLFKDDHEDIYMYDLSNSQETRVSHNISAMHPSISGNNVVCLYNIGIWEMTYDVYVDDLYFQ